MKIPASYFGMVLGLSGIGQSWRVAVHLWHAPPVIGEAVLAVAALGIGWHLVFALFPQPW